MTRPLSNDRRSLMRFISAVCLAALLFTPGCATNPVTGQSDFVLMSEDDELALGRSEHQKVMSQASAIEDKELTEYVNRLGQELADHSHRNNLVYRFTVLDMPMINAFAIPGGYIYITRGILAYMQSETQLVGVLGHEIGHVTGRHSVRQHARSTLVGLLGVAATVATGDRNVAQLSNVLGGAAIASYSRGQELEADRLGAEYLARVGYDPREMKRTIEILKANEQFEIARAKAEEREPVSYHLFSSHPANDRRLAEVVEAAKRFQTGPTRQVNDEAFLRRLDGVTFGLPAEEGVLRNGKFYHKTLDFYAEFPDGWRVENLPDRLVAIAPDNDEIIQFMLEDQSRRQEPKDFLVQRFKNAKDGRALKIHGEPAYTAATRLSTNWGTRDAQVTAKYHGDKVFIVLGAKEAKERPGDAYFNTVKSLRRIRTSEAHEAEALKIKIVRAGRGDTIESLARKSPITNYAAEQLRLLNGLYPDGEPTPGQLIKIVH